MVRNFEKFEVEHWYIYTGYEAGNDWPPSMKKALDHNPRRCVKVSCISKSHASFGDIPAVGAAGYWDWWDTFDNWIEIKDPSKHYHLVPGEKYYNAYMNEIETHDFYSIGCSGDLYYALIDSKEEKDEGFKPKFKVGDRVKIVRKFECKNLRWVYRMDEYIGGIFEIIKITGDRFQIDSSFYWFLFECAELVEESGTTNESIGLGPNDTGFGRNTYAPLYSSVNTGLGYIAPRTIDGGIEFYIDDRKHFVVDTKGTEGVKCPSVNLDVIEYFVDEKPKEKSFRDSYITETILDKARDSGEICNYCPLPEESRGCKSSLVNCEGAHCKEAEERFLEENVSELKPKIEFTVPKVKQISIEPKLIKKFTI